MDILSNTCLDSSEMRALHPYCKCSKFNTYWGKNLLLEFLFFSSKASYANIANSMCLWKT